MRIALVLAALVLAGPAGASPPKPAGCRPVVRDAWVRMAPMMPMAAGFFRIDNRCAERSELIGATSPRFADVTLHETRVEQGMSRMRPLSKLALAPGASVEFLPGGRHLMLAAPNGTVAPGDRVRVELRFADGHVVPVDFTVRSAVR